MIRYNFNQNFIQIPMHFQLDPGFHITAVVVTKICDWFLHNFVQLLKYICCLDKENLMEAYKNYISWQLLWKHIKKAKRNMYHLSIFSIVVGGGGGSGKKLTYLWHDHVFSKHCFPPPYCFRGRGSSAQQKETREKAQCVCYSFLVFSCMTRFYRSYCRCQQ